jgi:hypothetical protein
LTRNLTRSLSPGGESFDYYVDAVSGSDSNDGLTQATAFATINAFTAATTSNKSASVGFKRGQRHVPSSSMVFGFTGKWGGYGDGHLPFFDCSQPVTMGDITAHPTHANVYQVEVTHAVAPPYIGNNQASNGIHVGLFWETSATGIQGQYLTPIFNAANTDAGEAFVRDNAGRCFVQKVGSSNVDVRTETTGSVLRYTFRLADSSDPRTPGAGSLRYACYAAMNVTWNPGAKITGLAFGRNLRKDLTNCATAAVTPLVALPEFTECVWLDPGCHANVGPSNWRKCVAVSRTLSRSNGGAGWHNYTDVFEPRVPDCEDSFFQGFTYPFYCHGIAQNPVIQSITGRRNTVVDALYVFGMPLCTVLPEFEDFDFSQVGYIFDGPGNLRKFRASMVVRAGGCAFWNFGPNGTCEDGVVVFPSSGNRYITGRNTANQAAAEALGSPTLRRITISPALDRMHLVEAHQRFVNYVIEDTAGIRDRVGVTDPNSTLIALDATATNSYFGPTTTGGVPLYSTLGDYQAKVPGIGNDVVMYNNTKVVTFAGDPLVDPTITGPAEILGLGMGVDPAIILALPAKLANVPTLQSMGLAP